MKLSPLLTYDFQASGKHFSGLYLVLAGRCTTELAGWPGRRLPFSEWKGRRKQIQICRINCFSANGIRVCVEGEDFPLWVLFAFPKHTVAEMY